MRKKKRQRRPRQKRQRQPRRNVRVVVESRSTFGDDIRPVLVAMEELAKELGYALDPPSPLQ